MEGQMPRSILAIGGGAFAALVAMAAPADAAFEVRIDTISGAWTDFAPGTGISRPNPTMIRWGDPVDDGIGDFWFEQSAYDFDRVKTPVGPVGLGESFKIGEFIHENNPITDRYPFLSTAELTVEVSGTILENGADIGTFAGLKSVFDFEHTETPNDGNDPRDIVVATTNTAKSQQFTIGDREFIFAYSGFLVEGELLDRFLTHEGQHNMAHLQASVSEVPLPAALPLMLGGIGAVYGLARRRRHRRDHAAAE
jgi:hypothetical protein